MSVCLVLLANFCKLINEGSWGATRLHQILFQIGKSFYGNFSDVATGLWRGLFEPYTMSWVVPAFQMGQNVHRRRPQIWMAFHFNGWWSRWESATVVHQLPYSTDLDPADFFLFPKWKSSLKGRRFQTVEEIEENLIWDICAIPQNTFQKWKKCWERCIKSGGVYFERDKFD